MRTARYLLLAFALIPLSGTCQSFNWGFPFRVDDETNHTVMHFRDGDIFRLKAKYNPVSFDYNIALDQLSEAELERVNSIDLTAETRTAGNELKRHLDLYQKDGRDFVFFSTEYEGKTKEVKLFRQDVNVASGERTPYTLLSSVEGKGVFNTGNFKTAQSPDGAYFAILKIPAFYKKEQEKFTVEVYDADFKKIKEINQVFDRQAVRGPLYSIEIGNDGEVYVMASLDMKKSLPHVEMYTSGLADTEMATTSFKQPDDYQLLQNYMQFIGSDLCIISLVSWAGSGEVQIGIDYDGRSSGAPGNGLLISRFSGGELLYQERTDFEQSIPNLMIKEVLPSEKGTYVVMERLFESAKSSSSDITSTDVKKDYSYLNDGFVVAYFNPESGQIDWFYEILIDEPDTRNDNGAYLSVLSMVRGSMLVLMYNETRSVYNRITKTNVLRRFPIIEVITSEGQTARKEPMMAAGVGVEPDQKIELDTSVIKQLEENKYLVRGRSRAEYKYGYLIF